MEDEEEVIVTGREAKKTKTSSRAYSRAVNAQEARMERDHGVDRGCVWTQKHGCVQMLKMRRWHQ